MNRMNDRRGYAANAFWILLGSYFFIGSACGVPPQDILDQLAGGTPGGQEDAPACEGQDADGKLRCAFSRSGDCSTDIFLIDRHSTDWDYEGDLCRTKAEMMGVTFCGVSWQQQHDTGAYKCQGSLGSDCERWRISIHLETYDEAEAETLCGDYIEELGLLECMGAYANCD